MCDTRQDLAQKLSTFGADIQTTAMHWKKQGNQLEWIVRHMSWKAPWTSIGKDHHNKSMASRTDGQTHSRRFTRDRAAAEQAANDIITTMPGLRHKQSSQDHLAPRWRPAVIQRANGNGPPRRFRNQAGHQHHHYHHHQHQSSTHGHTTCDRGVDLSLRIGLRSKDASADGASKTAMRRCQEDPMHL